MLGSHVLKSPIMRYSFITLLFFVLVTLVVSVVDYVKQQDTRPVKLSEKQIEISTSYLVDESEGLSTGDIVKQLERFISAEPDNIPFTLGKAAYWTKFTLKNNTDKEQQLVLHVDNTMLESVQSFELSQRGVDTLDNSELVDTAFPKLTLSLKAYEGTEVLLRLKSAGPPNIPLIWYQYKQYQTKESLTRLLFGAVIGVLIIMALYNLVIFAAIKDKVYLVYLGYLISSFLVLGTVNGYGYLLFETNVQSLLNKYSLFFHYYLLAFLILFTIYFIRYDENKGFLYKLGIYSVFVLIVLSFITQFLSHELQAKIFFSFPPVFYAYSLTLVALRVKKHFDWIRFYLISWVPLLIGAAIQPLVLLNQLDYSFLLRNAFLIAVLVEIAFMSFALAERMRRHEQDRLNEISYHPATGIARKILLEKQIARMTIQTDAKFSVLVIRPEHIERVALYVNDAMNTELFKRMHRKLSPLFAYNDAIEQIGDKGEKIAFLSGNSLSVVMNLRKNHQPIETLIQSINTLVEEAYQVEELNIPLKAVVGIANYPEHGREPFVLLNRAQLALPEAELSQNRWAYFAEHQSDKTGYRLQLASDIHKALTQGHFELYHQPQIDLKTMRVCGSECLIRWNHHEQGFIPPTVFIPVAEDMGLINQVTHWVIKQAIAQHSVLLSQGYKHHLVSINISGKDIAADDFYSYVVTEIEEAEVPANKIVFELTESATITDNEQALATIEKLTKLGVTISIDDFGTGYSSMAYISKLPFQELKVDRQFVENVNDNDKQKTIAETTVKMAKGLRLEVVAEGINSQADEDTLRQFGCDIGQGYYYAKPMAFDDYLTWLAEEVNGRPPMPLEGDYIPKGS
ncbi:EAL domain-containing protein [Thalassotalea sp. M1531]|uniref:EAL domain-containing protein n=1 Tax=Thalassotalea algicola TaxID=2716224 RepID=A0A7Y0LCX1_9GAMM|nr:EAL domain-containing protein [Thalassotalea algicola]NMP32278.1 EAL domain-containing protein [Thalassotalea algicola]